MIHFFILRNRLVRSLYLAPLFPCKPETFTRLGAGTKRRIVLTPSPLQAVSFCLLPTFRLIVFLPVHYGAILLFKVLAPLPNMNVHYFFQNVEKRRR